MKKIINYINNNKLYLLILLTGLIMLGIQLDQVIMYADDYSLGILSNAGGFKAAWDYFTYNYIHWGGGFTGLIVISILTIGFKAWTLIEILLMLSIVLLTIKVVHLKDGKYKEVTAILVWILYFIINIYTSRETIYWLDGSIAYVLTSLQVLFYTYLIYTRMHYPNMRKKYDYVLFPLAAFFGGWSSAQSGAMVVLISIIVWVFAKFVNKEKIPKFYLLSSILTLVGYCIFFFAPGNSARMAVNELFSSLGIFSKILYRSDSLYGLFFDYKTYPYLGLPFFVYFVIILLLLVTRHLLQKEKNEKLKFVLSLTCIYNFMYLVLAIVVGIGFIDNWTIIEYLFSFKNLYQLVITNTLSIKDLIPYGVATITVLIILAQTLYISIKNKESILLLLITWGIASQVVMVMAPQHPFRTTLITIVSFIVAIAYLFKYILDNDIDWHYSVAILFLIRFFPIGCVLIAAYYASNKYLKDSKIIDCKKFNTIIFICLLAVFAAYNWAKITVNYKTNKEIDAENMERIKEYKKHPNKEKILVLIAPVDESYGFTPLSGSEWVEIDVNKYFKLDKKTDIMFEEEYEIYIKSKKIINESK